MSLTNIQNVTNWEWSLAEPSKENMDADDFKEMMKMKGKWKVFRDNEDDENGRMHSTLFIPDPLMLSMNYFA